MNVTEWSVEDHVKRRAAREARGLGREVDVGVEGVGKGSEAEEGGEESAKGVGRVRWQTTILLVLALACGVEKR